MDLTPAAEPTVIERERTALHEVLRHISERVVAEERVASARSSGNITGEREYERACQALAEKIEAHKRAAREADEARRRAIVDAAIAGEAQARAEFAASSRQIAASFEAARKSAVAAFNRARSEADAAFEAGQRGAANAYTESLRPLNNAAGIIESMRARLATMFQDYRKFGLVEPPAAPTRESYRTDDLVGLLFDRLGKLEPPLKLLEGLIIPKAMKGIRWLWVFYVPFLILVYPLVLVLDGTLGVGVAALASLVIGLVFRVHGFALCKTQLSRLYDPIARSLTDATALVAHCRTLADERLETQRSEVTRRRDVETQTARENQSRAIAAGEGQRDERLRAINQVYAETIVDVQTRQHTDLHEAVENHERQKEELRTQADSNTRKLEERYRALEEKIRTRHDDAWNALARQWRDGMAQVGSALGEIGREVDRYGPRWDDPAWPDRPLPRDLPAVVRLGDVTFDLGRVPGGVAADARLMEGVATSLVFPALTAFPGRTNLLVETPAQGRAAAVGVLQAAMLRLLTCLPPAQVRFTIVDPIGIGRNFGAFMHLADFDEALVTGQVWTDPRQIEERLGDLCIHMEKVTQKYLRNEYATIEEYNAVAGEVAEPYRVLVVADFPAQFDEKSAARLAAIAAGGIPCGVLTLVAVDVDRPLPPGFVVDDLRARSTCLAWNGEHLVWSDRDFGGYPLALDVLPPPELANRLIHRAGAAARDAKRVEVPFEFIAPAPEAWWTRDSRSGIDVALGKAGATKRQNLTLGQGTSQHVLIAGRTGSGKSTLLHALIINLALNYSPDEVDLYLIDFKQGVEFKVYAIHELPHASVVAIESEREFGISVLQRLDVEMRGRADRFREVGVQDLNGYRNVAGTPPLPRILLIVDEFQEFFVEEDKVAQEAALLLDRLVRQGRAFGVHVHLGSQTLGGAYALARSTLGQMAVRIALQCSEADAHLILSEQNTAARLLSRPGEAVYNDANGLAEGNHFFQVVWLSDERKESYLKEIGDLARTRPPVLKRTPIIFEGDAPAELRRNPLLRRLLDEPAWPASPRSAQAWLGDAVAIKDPTAAHVRRQGGNHLLVVGQNADAALGIMTAALVSLAAQYPPATSDTARSGARFAALDGTPEDDPRVDAFARVARALPHGVEVGGWRDAARIVARLAAEVQRRQQPDGGDGPELFLFIHDLPRFRDLRRREDDFGFSRREDEANPSDLLETILREGPGLGVHVLTWCDTLNNLNRAFSNQILREFEMRVLFQMSPNDSAHLLDSPFASKLGPHRALFFSEDQNRLEKFRPYGLPGEEWLAWLRERLSRSVEGDGG
jgi:DNA segregation ATPase FtsK/SpoIIIE, S-DNA-T family